jgi:hypothetical protein
MNSDERIIELLTEIRDHHIEAAEWRERQLAQAQRLQREAASNRVFLRIALIALVVGLFVLSVVNSLKP